MKASIGLPVLLSLLAGCATGPQSTADVAPLAARAQIPFVSYGGVDDWRAEGTGAILIKARMGRYYRATFMAPCIDLPTAEHIGFETGALDTLDKFDSIVVRGRECSFRSFEEIPKPAKW